MDYGKGVDRLGNGHRDSLLYRWQWIKQSGLSGGHQSDTRRLPCCSCEAVHTTASGLWQFDVTEWTEGSGKYQCEAKFTDDVGSVLRLGHTGFDGLNFPDRISAQRHAEVLMYEFFERSIGELGPEEVHKILKQIVSHGS